MKKYLSYLIIVIALVGVLGNGKDAQAEAGGQNTMQYAVNQCKNLNTTQIATLSCLYKLDTPDGWDIGCVAFNNVALCRDNNKKIVQTSIQYVSNNPYTPPTAPPVPPAPTAPPTPPPPTTPPTPPSNSSYKLLAPLPDSKGEMLNVFPINDSSLGIYLNLIIELVIGISSVLAVLMIVMGGMEYIGSELVSSKEAGKDKIQNALLGLLIALGAWALLNTINGDLLNSDIKIPKASVTVTIEDFKISGAQTRDGKPGTPVNFKKDACPAALTAETLTGVNKALVLAIFAQETNSGKNTGGCVPANANMTQKDKEALVKIVGSDKAETTNVSCSFGGGHGGAVGLMQFLPSTWLETVNNNSNKDPWKTEDALTAAAIYLKKLGAVNDPRNAACKYYSGDPCQPGRDPANEFYGNQVVQKMASISDQIKDGGCNTGGATTSW